MAFQAISWKLLTVNRMWSVIGIWNVEPIRFVDGYVYEIARGERFRIGGAG